MSTTLAGNTRRLRDTREIVRDEHHMRPQILAALAGGPLTIPEIAQVVGRPPNEVVFWVMGMRKYGHLAECRDVTDEGYFRYQTAGGDQS
jgi:predicted Rossmann fold nucleotide-binding protein DprA/Smf involved in DNA uptake